MNKAILILLFCTGCAGLFKDTKPVIPRDREASLTIVPMEIMSVTFEGPKLTPIIDLIDGHFAASWTDPTGEWIPEYSTNLVNWRFYNEANYAPSELKFTETGLWSRQLFIRLRKR